MRLAVFTLIAAFLVPRAILAGSVFLNGANVDGMRNQVYANCTVTFDANGNVLITTPPAPSERPAPPPVAMPQVVPAYATQHYWLVTEKAAPGMTQFDVDLMINGKFVRKFLDDEEHVVLEVTKFINAGPNKVLLIAHKNMGEVRRSSSPNHFFRIVIGEGESGGRNVIISRKLIDYKRTALETKDAKDEFIIQAR